MSLELFVGTMFASCLGCSMAYFLIVTVTAWIKGPNHDPTAMRLNRIAAAIERGLAQITDTDKK